MGLLQGGYVLEPVSVSVYVTWTPEGIAQGQMIKTPYSFV